MEEPPAYSRVIARTGETEIREDMLRFRLRLELDKFPRPYLEAARHGAPGADNDLKAVLDGVLEKMIDDACVLAFAARRGVTLSDNDLAARFAEKKGRLSQKELEELLRRLDAPYFRWKQLVESDIRVEHALENLLGDKIKVSLEEIHDDYDRRKEDFRTDEEVRVRHIVTDSRDKAEDILLRIRSGENFAKLAVNHSISPDRARGGDLGYYPRGAMPAVFDTAFKLEKGEVSRVVESEYGFHIFKLIARRPAGYRKFEEIMPAIHEKIFEEKLKTHYRELLARVREEIPVGIHKDNLRSFIP